MTLPHRAHTRVKSSDGGGRRFRQLQLDVVLPVAVAERLDAELDAKAGQKGASRNAFVARAIQYALAALETEREQKSQQESLVVTPNAAQVVKANQKKVVV